jgi:uncharacterized protein YeaO (DUF488 family)
MAVRLQRVYDPPSGAAGKRVLVDRVWPRGVKKEDLHLDLWLKDVAPSTSLRKWFGHDPKRWQEFGKRYRAELRDPALKPQLDELRALARKGPVTLLYGARDREHNQAVVLRDLLES